MNSVVGDLDHLADDDIAGVRALYATQNFSLSTGSFFSFQVPAPSGATSFVGSGLPPGVSINPTSGLISGVPTTSGIYNSAITVAGPNGAIETLTFQFTIIGAPTQQGQLLAKLDIKVFRLAADPARPRIYATMPDDNSVAVIDSVSRTLIKTIFIGSHPQGLAVSADGSKLWVANSGSTTSAIGVVDLNTLQALPSLAAPNSAYAVVEGLDGRLYVSSASGFGFNTVMQIDSKTGITTTFGFIYQNALLAISPDRNTLFAADQGLSPSSMVKVDVSTATPLVSQTPPFNSFGSNGEDLKISHDGKLICFVNGAGNGFGGGYTTSEIPTDNLAAVNGVFNTGAYPSSIAWSNDDSRVYHDVASQGKIDIFDTRTFQLLGAIDIGSSSPYGASDLVVDNTDKQLFVAVTNGVFPIDSELRVYSTGQSSGGPVPPSIAQKSFANLSTRMRTQLGDNVLIGGFIINGHDPKTVVVRAIGPSVPLTGNLADPMLQLFDSTGAIVASNDNWGSNGGNIIPSGLVPKDQRESAVVATLQPGSYTAIVRGVGDITGVALVELYDISGVTDSKLANISTRGNVETGDNVMIGGFIIGGDQPTRVLIRAIGTSLAGAVPGGALQDPVLQLFDGTGSLIFQNDDWRSGQEQQIIATGLAPPNDRESAIVATLQPGSYTAIVRGKNDTTGVALVEVYNLETN